VRRIGGRLLGLHVATSFPDDHQVEARGCTALRNSLVVSSVFTIYRDRMWVRIHLSARRSIGRRPSVEELQNGLDSPVEEEQSLATFRRPREQEVTTMQVSQP
jgi:hypothetical protein